MKLAYSVATPDTHEPGMLALQGPLERSFALLAANGYQGVDLMARDPRTLDVAAIASLAREHGLAIVSFSTGQARKEDGLQLCHPDERERARARQRLGDFIDAASLAGPDVHVNLGTLRGTLGEGERRATDLHNALAALTDAGAQAAARRVTIALEPQCRFVSNWLNTVDEARRLIADLPAAVRPGFGLVADVYHVALEEASLFSALIRAAPLLRLVQLSDSNRLAPGRGHLPFGDVVRVLAASGYEGHLSIEAKQLPTPQDTVRASAQHLLPILADLGA